MRRLPSGKTNKSRFYVAGVAVHTFLSNTLYDASEVKRANGGKAPATYKAFQAAAARLPAPPSPVEDPPDKLPPVDAKAKGTDEKSTAVPSLKEVGYSDEPTTPFHVWAHATIQCARKDIGISCCLLDDEESVSTIPSRHAGFQRCCLAVHAQRCRSHSEGPTYCLLPLAWFCQALPPCSDPMAACLNMMRWTKQALLLSHATASCSPQTVLLTGR